MGFFSRTRSDEHCGLVIDIGSGSVGLALVLASENEVQPRIIWSCRENSLIKEMPSLQGSLREITTALINAFLRLGSEGIRSLRDQAPGHHINDVLVTIAAPWSYTITKTVNYSEENPFTVSKNLLADLATASSRDALESLAQTALQESAGLTPIDQETIGYLANDYPADNIEGVVTKHVALVALTAVTHQRLLTSVEEAIDKLIPRATVRATSFMMAFYETFRRLHPTLEACCLVDVTNEATEIGIVRDGFLQHVTHTAFGSFSITREIAAIGKIPKEEAFVYLRGGHAFFEQALSVGQQEEVQQVLTSYREKVTQLFTHTGDTLAIPKTIYVHADTDTEVFFAAEIARAAKTATGMEHTVHTITAELTDTATVGKGYPIDTALILAVNNFHHTILQAKVK